MFGTMMDTPLLISSLIRFAARYHGDTEIVTRTVEGAIHRYTWRDAYGRTQRLANALTRLGVKPGDRVATLAWNTHRHLELYYAVSGMGSVLHTINPRLFLEQIRYIVNHAEDRYVFTDLTFVPLLEGLAPTLPKVKGYVIMTDRAHMPATKLPDALCYEELVNAERDSFDWPTFDERTAASLCYTSGTVGNPKGALYSHRSTLLHTMAICSTDGFGLSTNSVCLPVVPMFHVNAWGIPYGAAMTGAKLVMPGPRLDGESVCDLLETEQVTMTAGVPTVWLMLLTYLRQSGKRPQHLKEILVGGSAVPLSMIQAFENEFGYRMIHAWGMTEMSPVGTCGRLKHKMLTLPTDQRHAIQAKQGRAICHVDLKIVGPDGKALPHDGKAFGELFVRGPWVISAYYNDEAATRDAFDDEGWFGTGDVATIDPEGYMQIVDRAKDVVKSGGEWISSIDLENKAMGHPGVAEAAVIGVPHPKWDERPILVVVAKPGASPTREDIIGFLRGQVPSWCVPDDVVFVQQLPHTATGKLSKRELREQLKDYRLPTASMQAAG
ncbi:MAG TPA: 3-(methylthio)propionyl-CoA ligase [Alphaproteobacteria bacterium]|nr:3-(methylthio)propionyl-CoA ligase [Alphaproteobacteria bacterium]